MTKLQMISRQEQMQSARAEFDKAWKSCTVENGEFTESTIRLSDSKCITSAMHIAWKIFLKAKGLQ